MISKDRLIKIRADHVTQLPKLGGNGQNSLYDEKDLRIYMTSFIQTIDHGWETHGKRV